jgi:hypothetical protein
MTQRLRFFVFTCRDPQTEDFRLAFVEALRQHYDTYYIRLRRRPIITGPVEMKMSLTELLSCFWRSRHDGVLNVYFNSTDTSHPFLSAALRLISPRGVWCFDMCDDLLLESTGLHRLRLWIALKIVRALSHIVVCSAPTLTELFPEAQHWGNASHILPLPRNTPRRNEVLIFASLDDRFDFDFVSKLADLCPSTPFHLYGRVSLGHVVTEQHLSEICKNHSNVHYCGPYTNDGLPTLLSRYDITLAPYRTDIRKARYIDPMRFYHCLNGGLELISTDIPAARNLDQWLHIAHDPSECAAILGALQADELTKLEGYSPITWEHKRQRLVDIITRHRARSHANETRNRQTTPPDVGKRLSRNKSGL